MNHFRILLTFSVFFISFSSFGSNDKVNIGIILRLSDKYNTFVKSIKEGIEYSYNRSQFKNKVKLSFYDHDGSFESISLALREMKRNKVDIILGAETSSDALLISRLTSRSKIPFITPTASSHKMFNFNKNTFRVSHDDKNVFKVVKFVLQKIKTSSVNVFHNVSKPNTDYIAKTIKDYLNQSKVPYIASEFLSDSDIKEKDLKGFLRNNSSIICLFAFENDLRKVFKIFRNKNKPMIYIGADGWGSNKSVYEKYVLGMKNKDLFTGIRLMYWNKTREDDFFLGEIKKMRKKIKREINEFHAIGFDSMNIILQALEKVKGRYSIEEFSKKMGEMRFHKLLTTSSLTFDNKNAPNKDMYVYKIDKHGVKFWGAVKQ